MLFVCIRPYGSIAISGNAQQFDRFTKTALEEWSNYGKYVSHCEGGLLFHVQWYNQNGTVTDEETDVSELISDYPNVAFEFHVNKEKKTASGFNKHYGFRIRERSGDQWTVSSISPDDGTSLHFDWRYRDWKFCDQTI